MLTVLLSPHGGIKVGHDDIPKLGAYFAQGCIPVMHGMPPRVLGTPSRRGAYTQQPHRCGPFPLAEVIGAEQCIFVKDVDGLYTDNPKTNPEAEFIPRIGARELIEKNLDDLVVERVVLDLLTRSQNISQIQIINGTREGGITRALNGEHVGTIIYSDK